MRLCVLFVTYRVEVRALLFLCVMDAIVWLVSDLVCVLLSGVLFVMFCLFCIWCVCVLFWFNVFGCCACDVLCNGA